MQNNYRQRDAACRRAPVVGRSHTQMKRYQKSIGTILVAAIALLAIDNILYIQDRKWMSTQTEIILSEQNADAVRLALPPKNVDIECSSPWILGPYRGGWGG